ncbi:methyltransferase [Streptomyces sp. KS 21]|uniref:methyltransferase n=1 Tax=Streptomyces sp. KS 21 TaxID=2485150 RepID=UPI00106317BD|nr:methyltransferase [Streptomyces sp. KS 21]TDU76903.1 methyltransferase family protein [Streptomyces sp. KS 21]
MTRFVTALERSGLAEFLADFPGDSVDRLQWAAATRGLDGELRALAGFLLLGEPAAADRLPAALAQALPALIGSGVAVRRGDEVRLVDVSLFRSAGVWLFAEPPSPFPVRHYFGRDSVALARRTGCRAGDRVLDLCSGPGFQGLVAAQRGAGATLVELLPETAEVARLNAEINGMDDRIEVLVGDLYAPLPAGVEPYDRVIANIPFLPTLSARGEEAAHEGGEDGFGIGRRVLAGLPRHLAAGGTAHLTGLLLQADRELVIGGELRAWAAENGYGLTVTLTERMAVDADSDLVQTTVSDHLETDPQADPEELTAAAVGMYARRGATAARLAYLRIDGGMADFRILDRAPG